MGTAILDQRAAEKNQPKFLASLSDEERRLYNRIPDKIGFVGNPMFSLSWAEEKLFGPDVQEIEIPQWRPLPESTKKAEIRDRGFGKGVLTPEEEKTLFLRYNYARYRLCGLVAAQQRRKSTKRARQMLVWYKRTGKARADLVRANLALVVAMAKRIKISGAEFSEVVSEGNMALLRSVEKFDVSRGRKFSTYACRAILISFFRLTRQVNRYRQHYLHLEPDSDSEQEDYRKQRNGRHRQDSVDDLWQVLGSNSAWLTRQERRIINEEYFWGQTPDGIGRSVGLTGERIRQIKKKALKKLRAALSG